MKQTTRQGCVGQIWVEPPWGERWLLIGFDAEAMKWWAVSATRLPPVDGPPQPLHVDLSKLALFSESTVV